MVHSVARNGTSGVRAMRDFEGEGAGGDGGGGSGGEGASAPLGGGPRLRSDRTEEGGGSGGEEGPPPPSPAQAGEAPPPHFGDGCSAAGSGSRHATRHVDPPPPPSPAKAGEDERGPKRRVIKLEHPGGGRRRVYVPVKRRAARFIEALGESGNVSLACEVAGIGKDRVYRLRKEDEAFAAGWAEAKAAFEERAEQDDGIDLDALGRDGLAVRRGRGGCVQIVSAHPAAWTRRDEELFFAYYAETGNVAASARAAGFSGKAAWERARTVPAFRDRLAEAKEEATLRLEHYLIEEGTNLLKGKDGAPRDPQLAMWLLKREDQKKAGTLRRGGAVPRVATDAEVQEALIKALRRRGDRLRAERGPGGEAEAG